MGQSRKGSSTSKTETQNSRRSKPKPVRRKNAKPPKIDGLGPDDLKRIHKALGNVRRWSEPVRLVRKRSMGADGFPRCENKKCPHKGKPVPSIQVDHIKPIGEIGALGYIQRMFIPSAQLQALCKQCHSVKTAIDKKKKPRFTDAF
jgi:5-methylcytosine-specific restriction endonuclease McrA